MWLADGWKDYEVIDCSKGEKLERWGDYLLVRPDPQVIWDTPKKHKGWKKMNGHYHRSSKGGIVEIQGTAERTPFTPEEFTRLYELACKGTAELALIQRQVLGMDTHA